MAGYRRAGLTAGLVSAALIAPVAAEKAAAQNELPTINVTDTRLTGTSAGSGAASAPGGIVTGGGGITGASTTVITSADIERSPETTLADIISREAGVQTSSLFSNVNGAATTVDMRGFGITGPSNTLILVNGRRQNDADLPGFDLSTIAKNSIERIEITRGNSGAVVYGDGAVGGVINIVTKTGANTPPSARIEAAMGSFRTREGNASATVSSGGFSAAVFGNAIDSDGYRVNNGLRQRVATGDLRYTANEGSAFLTIGGDSQRLGLPGPRNILGPGDSFVAPYNEYLNDRRGTSTPYDFNTKDGFNITGGFTRIFVPGFELIVDGGIRRKDQTASFFGPWGMPLDAPLTYLDTVLTTSSVTPRVNITLPVFGLPSRIISGVDFYNTDYDSNRRMSAVSMPIHDYLLEQRSLAAYWQQTVTVLPSTDISYGGRIQRNDLSARDNFDPNAPFNPGFRGSIGSPLDEAETNRAYHLGLEHRFNQVFAVFGRMAQSFRVPNVDERVGMSRVNTPTNFQLKTQRSHDAEAGVRLRFDNFEIQSSVYDMRLTNELHFSPVTFANTNLDPTQRRGWETIATWRVTDSLRLKGNLTYIDATYREGIYVGNQVPVVSRWASNVGLSWNILDKQLVFDGVVRYHSRRFLDQDDANVGAFMLPSQTVVDVRLGGEYKQFFWSASIQNLFDRKLLDYGLDYSYNDFFTGARVNFFSLYPLAGRTYMVRAGINFDAR
jgi:iron complex outermembrane receptor protein